MTAGIIGLVTPAELLAFEAEHPSWRGDKETRIRRDLGLTPARYITLLERAAVSHEGQSADPLTAHRVTSFVPARARWSA